MNDEYDERNEEIEILKAIYCEDMEQVADRLDGKMRIRIRLRTVDVMLEFTLSDLYPMQDALDCRYISGGDLQQSVIEELLNKAEKHAKENIGMPAIFIVASEIEQWLQNKQDNENREEERRALAQAEIEHREEMRKFEGQRVTPESFAEWLQKFTLEMNIGKLNVKVSEKDNQQLTGKQMFLKNDSIYLTDEDELEGDQMLETVPIDESLFTEIE
ncbi:hypothetical protein GJ496_010798 [Pomphorhynchus laevis]|nr:hypothetical protein GJ496_010798 [Pomphorhynchus laevis]